MYSCVLPLKHEIKSFAEVIFICSNSIWKPYKINSLLGEGQYVNVKRLNVWHTTIRIWSCRLVFRPNRHTLPSVYLFWIPFCLYKPKGCCDITEGSMQILALYVSLDLNRFVGKYLANRKIQNHLVSNSPLFTNDLTLDTVS